MDATNQPVFEQEGQAKIIEHLSRKNGGDRPPLCARCWQPVERRTNTQQAWKAYIMGKSPTPASTFRKARVAQYRDGSPNPEARVLGGVLTRGAIERALSGREATEADKATRRVRILPLHSIGHSHADCPFRRLLVEIPPNCPLRADDRAWAFSGLPITGEISGNLVRTDER